MGEVTVQSHNVGLTSAINIDLSSKVFCGIQLRAISQGVAMNLIHKVFGDYIFTPQPSGLEGYCRHGPGGRAGGRLPNLRNPYLCNRLLDFLHLKFCGIV